MTQPTPDTGVLADIASANALGWSVEFQPSPNAAPATPLRCIFRRYGSTGDSVAICRAAKTQSDAFDAAKTAWQAYMKWEAANP